MIKHRYIKTVLCLSLITVCLLSESSRSQQTDNSQPAKVNVGRQDPFAEVSKPKPAPKEITQPSLSTPDPPQLFLEIVSLKFIDVRSLEGVIESMSSGYGSISFDEKTNSLIIYDTKEHLTKILAQIQRIDKTIAVPIIEEQPRPELSVETVTLKFLDAGNLKVAIQNMSSEYGIISIDKKSNSLIICDTKEKLKTILAEVRNADKTPQQIMIEVVILDVQLDNDTEIGINWDILSDKTYDVGYRQNFTTSRLGSTIDNAANIGNATAFNTTGLGGEFSVISGSIRNVVHLIQEKRNVEILASPRVMTVSGQTASIEAIDEIPYQELSQSSQGGINLTYTEFKDVGIKLQVSATLTDDDNIVLTVEAEQNVQVGTTSPPRVDTRKVKASLLLRDGQVVIFGGLRRQEKTKEIDQIPFLCDLPLIGGLFKNTNTVINNSELVVFLSPHVYKPEIVADEEMEEYRELKEMLMLALPERKKAVINTLK